MVSVTKERGVMVQSIYALICDFWGIGGNARVGGGAGGGPLTAICGILLRFISEDLGVLSTLR
jgi:hypothetical protein